MFVICSTVPLYAMTEVDMVCDLFNCPSICHDRGGYGLSFVQLVGFSTFSFNGFCTSPGVTMIYTTTFVYFFQPFVFRSPKPFNNVFMHIFANSERRV